MLTNYISSQIWRRTIFSRTCARIYVCRAQVRSDEQAGMRTGDEKRRRASRRIASNLARNAESTGRSARTAREQFFEAGCTSPHLIMSSPPRGIYTTLSIKTFPQFIFSRSEKKLGSARAVTSSVTGRFVFPCELFELSLGKIHPSCPVA